MSDALAQCVDRRLALVGTSLERLRSSVSQVVVFGSRAVGCTRPDSDLDLLIVGPCREHRSRALDVLAQSDAGVRGHAWLTSEIASHIAAYGVWLHGRPDWVSSVRLDGGEAALRKRAHLLARCRAAVRFRSDRPGVMRSALSRINLDVLRWGRLMRGTPVPPTAHLMRELASDPDSVDRMATGLPRVLNETRSRLAGLLAQAPGYERHA